MGAVVVFLTASWILLYVVAIYPIYLGLCARFKPRPIVKAPQQPSLSIIIAVYNGEAFLADKLNSVLALEYPRDRMEVIVASDGSTDRTDVIAQGFAARGVRLISLPRGGKPAALNAAIPLATGEILVLTDVRQALAPESVARLMESFADPSVGVVSGELIIRDAASEQEMSIGVYWKFESWIRDRLSTVYSMFGADGSVLRDPPHPRRPIPPDMLLDDMYLPLSAFFRGYRLVVTLRRAPTITPPRSIPSSAARSGPWPGITRSCSRFPRSSVRATACGFISSPTSSGACCCPGR